MARRLAHATESADVAAANPELVASLVARSKAWAADVGLKPRAPKAPAGAK